MQKRHSSHSQHGNHGRAAGKAVQTVGQVYGVGKTSDHQPAKDNVEPREREAANGSRKNAKVNRQTTGKTNLGGNAAPVDGKHGKGNADDGEANHLGVRRQAERAAVRDRGQVIDETKDAGCQRSEQHKHELGSKLAHQQAGQGDGHQNDDAAHGGGPLLNQVTLGAIGADLLTDTLDL